MPLTREAREQISEAVRAAERGTKAEIVPMVVSRSGLYRDARHYMGLILSSLALSMLLMWEAVWLPWGWHASNAAWLLLCTVTAYAVGSWLGKWGPVIRLATSAARMRQKVRLRAERAFAQHGIAQTKERTGVLIMLSILERQVYILPDRQVAQLVSADEWNEVVRASLDRLRKGDLVGGLCAGIERCGSILAQVWPANAGENPNELPDQVVEER